MRPELDRLVRQSDTDAPRALARERPRPAAVELGIAEVNLVGALGELGANARDTSPLRPAAAPRRHDLRARSWHARSTVSICASSHGSFGAGTPSKRSTLGPEGGAAPVRDHAVDRECERAAGGCAWEPASGATSSGRSLHRLSAAAARTAARRTSRLAPVRTRRWPAMRHASTCSSGVGLRCAKVTRRDRGDGRARAGGDGGSREVICITTPTCLRAFQPAPGSPTATRGSSKVDEPLPIVSLLDGHPHTLSFLGAVRTACR